ncbi:PAS domain S-box protein [Pyxidicoccus parkwayensis]|uniref:histidine kinase n=1 Tax=Pyxidicoccus parkwayensis TaxID=2813578 RepID=A0ABX7NZP5_9BACT|nr:PAS domain S-box protein [Pyxidicoccus parkwaysis]QSQ24407.1 PAS domain S-box protein [Pyxidicoccus parkwaysis]
MRSPRWQLVAVTLGLGLVVTAGLVAFDHFARASLEREAVLEQANRAEQLAFQLQSRLDSAEQVTRTVATLAAPLRERSAVESLARGTLASTLPESIYGIGVWFAPYALEPDQRWVGTYVHRRLDEPRHLDLTYEWSTPGYDYLHQDWYQQGLQAKDSPFLTEPYFDVDLVYSTLAMSFGGEDGAPRGVVSVDVVLPQLVAVVARMNTAPHETFYVVTRGGRLLAHPREVELAAWARAHGNPRAAAPVPELRLEDLHAYEQEHGLKSRRYTQAAPVRDAGWTVYVSTDRDRLFAASRRLHVTLQAVGGALWLALLAGMVAGLRTVRVRALSRELAEHERETAVLERSERMLREVLETSMDGVASVDAGGRLVTWNTSAERMFGWRREDILGRHVVDTLCRPEDREERHRQFERIITGDASAFPACRLESLVLRRDGEVFPVEASLAAVHTDGEPRIFGFVSDVTERRRAEEERQRLLVRQQELLAELRRRSAELHAILDHMIEGVFVADADGRLSFVNQAGQRMCDGGGTDVAALDGDGKRCGTLLTMDGVPVARDALPLFRALRGEVVRDFELRAVRPGGERVLRMNAVPIPDEDGQVAAAVVVLHDITEAAEFDRLKDEFVRMAAHELKTPVTVMKSFAQVALRTDAGRDSVLRRLLEGIDRGANRIDHVVRTLLDVSQLHLRRMQLEVESLDLRALVEDTARRMADAHPEHPVHVRADEDGDAPVWGDPARLEQVLVALLDNAMRYSPPSAPVEVTFRTQGDTAEVSIRDEGIGIPEDKQARLFHRFYRPHAGTAHDRGGLGVGLYIAREIVRQHGGQLTLESREGEGTIVHIRLPLHAVRAGTDVAPYPPEHASPV